MYVAQAMYDATIAAWDSKYFYNRPRPSELDPQLPTLVSVPSSPSYPSEHAAAAQAAAVLAYFLPAEAQSFQTMAEQAGWSRVLAGVQYPSDYKAGLALGKRVADQVIAKAKADGSDAVWTGSVPTGACKWIGTRQVCGPGFPFLGAEGRVGVASGRTTGRSAKPHGWAQHSRSCALLPC